MIKIAPPNTTPTIPIYATTRVCHVPRLSHEQQLSALKRGSTLGDSWGVIVRNEET